MKYIHNSNIQIYIANLSEDVWPFIKQMSPKEQVEEINENASLSDRDLFAFAGEDDLIMILPQKVNPYFVDYYRQLFDNKNLYIFTPEKHTGEISLDFWRDKRLLRQIDPIVKKYENISLTCYSTTSQFLSLSKNLRCRYARLLTPESPTEENAWTVNFFGSKSGIHQLACMENLVSPEAVFVSDPLLAAKFAANFYSEFNGVVIKTNKGHAGAGILIFRPQELPEDKVKTIKIITSKLKSNYWRKFPIVVEKYIVANHEIGGGFPNAEFKICANNQVKLLYFCGMRVSKSGVFGGVEINRGVLPLSVSKSIIKTGEIIGRKLANFGYRGYFDLDFIVSRDKKLYLNESNVRRTGGTHVYHTCSFLFGSDFLNKTYALSENLYRLKTQKPIEFLELKNKLAPILFDKKTQTGLIITSANLLSQNKFGYIIFAKDKSEALKLENKMEILLQAS